MPFPCLLLNSTHSKIPRTIALGVRNNLPCLLDLGSDGYMQRLRKGFFNNWSVPEEHRERLEKLFYAWSRHVSLNLRPAERQALGESKYLAILEDFLEGLAQGSSSGTARRGNAAEAQSQLLQQLAVVVVNCTGSELKPAVLSSLGLNALNCSGPKPPSSPRAGLWCTITAPPAPKHLRGGAPPLVIAFGPEYLIGVPGETSEGAAEVEATQGVGEKERKIWGHFTTGWREKFSDVTVCYNPRDLATVESAAEKTLADSTSEGPGEGSVPGSGSAEASGASNGLSAAPAAKRVTILLILGLPPGPSASLSARGWHCV